jgi:hypothetical protein
MQLDKLAPDTMAMTLRRYLPDPSLDAVEAAELALLSNRFGDAGIEADKALSRSVDPAVRKRAAGVKLSLSCGTNAFGRRLALSPVLFDEDGVTPYSLEWTHARIKELGDALKESEEAVRFTKLNSSQLKQADQMLQTQFAKVQDQISDANFQDDLAKKQAEDLSLELKRLSADYARLVDRLEGLRTKLAGLAKPLELVNKTVEKLNTSIALFGLAATQYASQEYLSAASSFVGGLAGLSEAHDNSKEMLAEIRQQTQLQLESILADVEQLMQSDTQRSANMDGQIIGATMTSNFQAQRARRLTQLGTQLQAFRSSLNLSSAKAMEDVSRQVYKDLRENYAGNQLNQYRRYIDLVTARDEANKPYAAPIELFDAAHVRQIELQERDRLNLYSRLASQRLSFNTTVILRRDGDPATEAIFSDFDEAKGNEGPLSVAFEVPRAKLTKSDYRLPDARVRGLAVKLFKADGTEFPERFELRNPASTNFARGIDGLAYELPAASAEMGIGADPLQARKFAFSSPADKWELTFSPTAELQGISRIEIYINAERMPVTDARTTASAIDDIRDCQAAMSNMLVRQNGF